MRDENEWTTEASLKFNIYTSPLAPKLYKIIIQIQFKKWYNKQETSYKFGDALIRVRLKLTGACSRKSFS